jgi:hypothetical protein
MCQIAPVHIQLNAPQLRSLVLFAPTLVPSSSSAPEAKGRRSFPPEIGEATAPWGYLVPFTCTVCVLFRAVPTSASETENRESSPSEAVGR